MNKTSKGPQSNILRLEDAICTKGEIERLDDYKVARVVLLRLEKLKENNYRPTLSLMDYVQLTYGKDAEESRRSDAARTLEGIAISS